MRFTNIVMGCFISILLIGAVYAQQTIKNPYYSHTDRGRLRVADDEWKRVLPADAYYILREEGTEPAGTGQYVHNKKKGTYYCRACGNALFSSDTKYESGTGWPSFYQPLGNTSVTELRDTKLGTVRTAIACSRCGGHLGHVFDDGPQPTGLRYCMNGNALDFESAK